MKCPYCNTTIHFEEIAAWAYPKDEAGKDGYAIGHGFCPSCDGLIINKYEGRYVEVNEENAWRAAYLTHPEKEEIIYPHFSSRPINSLVPERLRAEFREAETILKFSTKASSALSRRCLQNVLREKAGIKKSNLADEIQKVLDSGKLPSHLAEAIDAVRNIGNFGAHPIKSTHSGEVVDVEPGEAEWNLDVLEGMFDFYFVQPAVLKKKREALNKKLADAGKPPMK
ncbi:hypothetical protein ES703_56297 [subsurface metagenome]